MRVDLDPPNYPLMSQRLTIKDHGVSIKGPLGGPGRGQGFEQDRISCFGSNRAPAPCNAQAFEVLASRGIHEPLKFLPCHENINRRSRNVGSAGFDRLRDPDAWLVHTLHYITLHACIHIYTIAPGLGVGIRLCGRLQTPPNPE